MVTSFADGSKISFEQAIVANATGMKVAQRGMLGYNYNGHVSQMTKMYDVEQLKEWGGIVLCCRCHRSGVFVFATRDDPKQRHYLNLYKLGKVPLQLLHHHLCHFEVPLSVARAVIFQDAVMAPLGEPLVDVTTAKSISKLGNSRWHWLHDLRSV